MPSSPLLEALMFLVTVPFPIVTGWWLWRVKRGRSVPEPGVARQGMLFHMVILGFYLWDAFKSSLEGNEVGALWLYVASLNLGLALALLSAVDRVAVSRAIAEARREEQEALARAREARREEREEEAGS